MLSGFGSLLICVRSALPVSVGRFKQRQTCMLVGHQLCEGEAHHLLPGFR
jgi:hypothetical protein